MKSTRARASDNRIDTLRLLAAVGYASTRQVARYLWGRCDDNTRRMARRTLSWLLKNKMVVSRREGDSIGCAARELLFALNRAGADAVKQHGCALVANKAHARDYIRHANSHRSACNSVYVAWPGDDVWSELSVLARECEISSLEYTFEGEQLNKIPDLMALDGAGKFEWIEVENSWRGDRDLVKLIECLRTMFERDNRISRMHFVVTAPAAKTIGRRIKKRLTHGPESGWSRQVKELDARILAQHLAVSELDPETLQLREIAL